MFSLVHVFCEENTYMYPHDPVYEVLIDIRNMRVLSAEQQQVLKDQPREILLEILDIYNAIMKNVHVLFEDLEPNTQ